MKNTKGQKGSKIAIVIVLILAVVAVLAACSGFITDIIWYKNVGYLSVFLTELVTKLKLGVPAFIVVSLISFVLLNVLKNNFLKKNNMSISSSKDHRSMKRVGIVLSVLLGLFLTYLVVYDLWFEILEFFNATKFGVEDPLFGNDISFYMFKYDFLAGLAKSAMIIIIGILAVILIYHAILVTMVSRNQSEEEIAQEAADEEQDKNWFSFNPNDPLNSILNSLGNKAEAAGNKFQRKNEGLLAKIKAVGGLILGQLTTLGVLFFLALAARIIFAQFGLLYGGTGVAYGAGYTDGTVTLNVYRILVVLSIVAAIMLVVAAKKKKILLAVVVPAAMIVVAILGGGASMLIQNFIVEPNELSKESRYIENNIKYTRLAYDLADIKTEEFVPDSELSQIDVLNNMETFSNIRINDFAPTSQFYNQTQSIRSYYAFNDVDVDRYYVNNEYTQVFLAAREIDQSKVEDSWLIRHLKYTHGYGLTLSRVDKITSSGQPEMLIQSIPPVSEVPEIEITRPEIYYGERTNNYVITNTGESEFDYPSGESNVYCSYEGSGGIELSLAKRILFAIKEQSLKLLVSTNINSDSKIHIYRNISERVNKIAPFLMYDNDPYIVASDGKLYWVMNAYTASDKYPYSEPYARMHRYSNASENYAYTDVAFEESGINYIRNSVKVIVDAYSGDTAFYICDSNDPIVMTYSKIYPSLFKNIDEMPQDLRSHLQYPNALFNIQADVYLKYHMTDVGTFYQNEDLWAIAKDIYGQTEAQMTANYFIMKLPGEDSAEFVSTIAYTPNAKSNLTGLLTARSDGDNYGELILYRMPKDRIIYGPAQVEAQVNQDADISKEFALWNNSGSTYSRGDMFVIPVENSLLYVEPVYLEAATSSLPEVKRVIVYYDEELAYADTLAEALDQLFGEGTGDPLKTAYPIISGHELAKELEEKANEPEIEVTPQNPSGSDEQPGKPDAPEITDTFDKESVAALIKEISEKLVQLQKLLEE